MLVLLTGLVIFLGVHSVSIVAPAWRESMVSRLGAERWKGLYSVASIAGFVILVWATASRGRSGDSLPAAGMAVARHGNIDAACFPLLLATYFPGRIKAAVKHPMLAATMAWALAHLLANGALADVLLFGGFLAWAVLDRISAGKRAERAATGAPPAKFNDIIAVVGGLAIYWLFVSWAHMWLFKVAPMP